MTKFVFCSLFRLEENICLKSIKESQLVGMNFARKPLVMSEIDAIDDTGIALREQVSSFGLSGRKPGSLPDFVQPARIAGISQTQVAPPNTQPTGDPDVDGVGFRQRASMVACAVRRRLWGMVQR